MSRLPDRTSAFLWLFALSVLSILAIVYGGGFLDDAIATYRWLLIVIPIYATVFAVVLFVKLFAVPAAISREQGHAIGTIAAERDAAVAENQRPPSPSSNAFLALKYLCEESAWGRQNITNDASVQNWGVDELERAAEAGEIDVWGRRDGKPLHEGIPMTYWINGMVVRNELFFKHREKDFSMIAGPRGATILSPIYDQLRVDMRQVKKNWPPPTP